MPCRPVEWRLQCQMIFRKAWNRALTAVRGRLGFILQITARADVPWSDAWRGMVCSMDTNRCHRASRCALQARRMAIAVPDELQESVGPDSNRALRAVCVSVRRSSCKPSRGRMCPGAMYGGVRGARWTQIDAIARADVPCRPLERRLPCQMIFRKAPTLGPRWPSPNNRSPHQRTARVRDFARRGDCYLAEGH